jgi:hypothetical protein
MSRLESFQKARKGSSRDLHEIAEWVKGDLSHDELMKLAKLLAGCIKSIYFEIEYLKMKANEN